MGDEVASRVNRAIERAAAAMERSRQLAGRIGDCELEVADTFEYLAAQHPDRSAELLAVAAHSRAFAAREHCQAQVSVGSPARSAKESTGTAGSTGTA